MGTRALILCEGNDVVIYEELNTTVVQINFQDYAVIDGLTLNDLDDEKLRYWINETYYDHDPDNFEVCRLPAKNFRKRG